MVNKKQRSLVVLFGIGIRIASGQEVAQMSDEQMQQLRQNKLVSSAVQTAMVKGSPLVVWD